MTEDSPRTLAPKLPWRSVLCATVIVLILLACAALPPPGYERSFARHLLHELPLGWLEFLQRVLPGATFNPAAVAFAVIVGLLAFALTLWLGRRFTPRWSWRSAAAAVLAPILLFIIAMSATGAVTRLAELAKDPSLIVGGRRIAETDMFLRDLHRERQAVSTPESSAEHDSR